MHNFLVIANAANTTAGQIASTLDAPESSNLKWWIVCGVCAFLIGLYCIGKRSDKKQAHKFFERMNEDLMQLLKDSFPGPRRELERQLSELWKHNPLVNLGSKVLCIELILTKTTDTTVECQIRVKSKNDAQQELIGSATRVYNWDYLPSDVANILIRSGKRTETLILYPPKN